MFLEEGLLKEMEKRNKNKSVEEQLIEKAYRELSNKSSNKENIKQLFLDAIKQSKSEQECLNKIIYEMVKKIYNYYKIKNELKIFRKIVDCLDDVVKKNYDDNSYKTFQMQKKYLISYLSFIDCSNQQSSHKPSKTKDVFVFDYGGGTLSKYNPKRYHCVGRLTEKQSLQDYLNEHKKKVIENSMLGITNNVVNKHNNSVQEAVAVEDVIRTFTDSIKSNNLNTIKLVFFCHGVQNKRYMLAHGLNGGRPIPLDFLTLLNTLNSDKELLNRNVEIINMSCFESNKLLFKHKTEFKKFDFDLDKVISSFAGFHNGIVTYATVMSDKIMNGEISGYHFYEYKYFKKKENSDDPELAFIIKDENLTKQYLEEKEKFLSKMNDFLIEQASDENDDISNDRIFDTNNINNDDRLFDANKYYNELYAVLISEYPLILDFKEKSKQAKNELLKTSVINNKVENGLKSKKDKKDCLIF